MEKVKKTWERKLFLKDFHQALAMKSRLHSEQVGIKGFEIVYAFISYFNLYVFSKWAIVCKW